ncbi:MAG: cytochrome b/b6 domain-containing protein [Planctomycetes bacterium]|nr:cytochrome b/b6 domain-containing protein [Planctomycetota bacterium]
MSLFQICSMVGIGGAVGVCLIHYVLVARRMPHPGHGQRRLLRYNLWERFLHVVLLATFLVLAVTSFWASIGWGGPMAGYTLMIHTTCGAVFAVAVAAMLVTWAADHAFADHDCQWLKACGCCSTRGDLPAGRFNASDKVYFWLAAPLVLVLLLTMLLSMVPVLGTAGQYLMYDLHRWSALVLVIATIWHAYQTTLAKPGGLTAITRGRVSSGWARRFHPLWGARAEAETADAGDSPAEETSAD